MIDTILTRLLGQRPTRSRRTKRPSYNDPPSTAPEFWTILDGLPATEIDRFDAWCAARALPLNMTSLLTFQTSQAVERRLMPAKVVRPGAGADQWT